MPADKDQRPPAGAPAPVPPPPVPLPDLGDIEWRRVPDDDLDDGADDDGDDDSGRPGR
jgi:hypothetical protein